MSLGQRPVAVAPRHTLKRRGVALVTLIAALLAVAVAHAPASGDTGATLRWDRHAEYRRLLADKPDSARALAARLIAADEHDFLGRWLHAAWVAADSAAKRATLAQADASPEHAGLQVEAGTLRIAAGDVPGGRAALDRAVRAYAAADRDVDVAWAALWKVYKRRDTSERASLRADAAQADSLARASGDSTTRAAALTVRGFVTRATDNRATLRLQREALAVAP